MNVGAAYDACRRVTARYGRTFFLATTLLGALGARSYAIYQSAEPGVAMLWRRVAVSRARRVAVAVPGAGRALLARAMTR
ncbi:hypothetical protein [Lentzea sp.]|uniref:hypothetical protein n=1 Tax=Lentzea sp. TaxID=56099 RepID=UPI002ED4B43D